MTSVCISNCVNDARDPRVPMRATYVNLYKWPESDAEFVRSVSSNGRRSGQMYLRSYTFSRKETVPEKTQKCFGRVKEKMVNNKKGKAKGGRKRSNKCLASQESEGTVICCSVRIFQRFLSCSASVDVVN
ncbi:hypothetical protein GBA52_019506 [Prunus armeniaca]|nr:hypothetical protein GBA52_019506 [Prunus armeniaca]